MPFSDSLKHLGTSLASYGSMAMFHMVGVTPEAQTSEIAFGGNAPRTTITVTDEDLDAVYRSYRFADAANNVVVFSGPQLSLFEIQHLAELFAGRSVAAGMRAFITTNHAIHSDAKRLGYVDTLAAAGVTFLKGVCFYILEGLSRIREESGRPGQPDLKLGKAGQHDHRASFQYRLAADRAMRRDCLHRGAEVTTLKVLRGYGEPVEGEALVMREGFSPRYDLDRLTGVISRIGHSAEGLSIKDRILVIPTVKGGVAGGWAFLDLLHKGIAPKGLVFGKLNPVMVQGAVLAKIPITEGWSSNALDQFSNRDVIRVDPKARTIALVRKAAAA